MLASMRRILILLLALLGPVAAAQAQETSRARLLALDAGQKYALALSASDSARRAALLEEADTLLRQLLADYPESEEAERLRAGESVAGVSFRALRDDGTAAAPTVDGLPGLSRAVRRACLDAPSPGCLFQLAVHAARDLSRGEHWAVSFAIGVGALGAQARGCTARALDHRR